MPDDPTVVMPIQSSPEPVRTRSTKLPRKDNPPGFISPHFHDERHALYTGWVFGMILLHELPMVPVFDADGFTDHFDFTLPDGQVMHLAVPPPPPGWTFNEETHRAGRAN